MAASIRVVLYILDSERRRDGRNLGDARKHHEQVARYAFRLGPPQTSPVWRSKMGGILCKLLALFTPLDHSS